MDRRDVLRVLAASGVGSGLAALSAPKVQAAEAWLPAAPGASTGLPYDKTGMPHRSYSGKILYNTDGVGEQGREFFTVTVQQNGTRTLRAQVEMDNIGLLRDVVLTADKNFRPIDAFVRLVQHGEFMGSTWYRFTEHTAECEGYTSVEGRIAQRFETAERINLFTCHPINCDAWLWGAVRDRPGFDPYPWFNSSLNPNGATGPTLIEMTPGGALIREVGLESVVTPAGKFNAMHYQLGARMPSAAPPLNTWVYGQDCVPVRLRSEGHRQTYELVALVGDVR